MPYVKIDTGYTNYNSASGLCIYGISAVSDIAYKENEETIKAIETLAVGSTSGTGKVPFFPPMYVVEEPYGYAIHSYSISDTFRRVGSNSHCIYNIAGRYGRGNRLVHLVDLAQWTPSCGLTDGEPGYLGSYDCAADGNFVFNNIEPTFAFSENGSKLTELPPFPDGILEEYPYYLALVLMNGGLKQDCILIFTDQLMYAVENESGTNEILHVPGKYKSYTFKYGDVHPVLENETVGSNTTINLGDSYKDRYNMVLCSNMPTAPSAEFKPNYVYFPAAAMTAQLGIVVKTPNARPIHMDMITYLPEMTDTLVGGIEFSNISYIALPTLKEDTGDHTHDVGDYPNVTISGTCPADTQMVFISMGDFVANSTTEANIDVKSLCDNVVTYCCKTYDGSFSMSFESQYHESILQNSNIAYNKLTSHTAYIVWCESTEPITASISGVTHNTCLSGDTLITMHDGSQRRLDSLHEGDVVMSGDGAATTITKLSRGVWSSAHTLYHFADGTVIDETYEHRFFNVTQGFWQKLQLWNVGDQARKVDGSTTQLVKVEKINQSAEQFGIWTESHDYYANGLLSGSIHANASILENATLEQFIGVVGSVSTRNIVKELGGDN